MAHQNAYSVAICALRQYENGNYKSDSLVTATYLRLSQAERERLEKEKNIII